MALRIKTYDKIKPDTYPDVDLYLDQNGDGSVDFVSKFPGFSKESRILRFYEDGQIERLEDYGSFWLRNDGKVVIE